MLILMATQTSVSKGYQHELHCLTARVYIEKKIIPIARVAEIKSSILSATYKLRIILKKYKTFSVLIYSYINTSGS